MMIGSRGLLAGLVLSFCAAAPAAWAACDGGFGRGWASGKGNGAFTMSPGSANCVMGYTRFFLDGGKEVVASEVKLTRAPKSGKISLSKEGIVYTPNAGFSGKDRFCTSNTAPEVKKDKLSGCVTVTVP